LEQEIRIARHYQSRLLPNSGMGIVEDMLFVLSPQESLAVENIPPHPPIPPDAISPGHQNQSG